MPWPMTSPSQQIPQGVSSWNLKRHLGCPDPGLWLGFGYTNHHHPTREEAGSGHQGHWDSNLVQTSIWLEGTWQDHKTGCNHSPWSPYWPWCWKQCQDYPQLSSQTYIHLGDDDDKSEGFAPAAIPRPATLPRKNPNQDPCHWSLVRFRLTRIFVSPFSLVKSQDPCETETTRNIWEFHPASESSNGHWFNSSLPEFLFPPT